MTGTTDPRDIVVGVDPVRNWRLAVAWGADEARHRGRRLRLVVAVPPRQSTRRAAEDLRHTARTRAADDTLRQAVDLARARQPEVDSAPLVADGPAAAVLVEQSRGAEMVVLGSRHLGGIEEFLSAGSLAVPVTAQAQCPVAVVGEAEHTTQESPYLVVGVDGSATSRAAVEFAFEEADLRGCLVRAVAAWQPPAFSREPGDTLFPAERRLLAEATSGLSERYPDVPVHHDVQIGSPVEVLARAGEHALAVVVGRRGRGGYSGMRVGSVVRGLLHRATCPVITVPGG
ncbi:universal stress protein [Streptomyces sp. C10-9-1]|uniref:universal stress protein n=1 Tax=Streptomyces sp. C10-9-1 TaxID=1859285 RepID=UPI0021113503|nr:universal stress protein [Streptomyces sp. C10-9-1]MCQ6554641.1 universal stress protein [Streptomyces sp. C10-9-1]